MQTKLQTIKSGMKRDLKKIRRRYRLLKIKWFLLFVLPVFIVVLAYQTAKEFLKLRMMKTDAQLPQAPDITPESLSE